MRDNSSGNGEPQAAGVQAGRTDPLPPHSPPGYRRGAAPPAAHRLTDHARLIGSPALETGAVDTKLSELDPGDQYTPPECLSSMLWGGQSSVYAA